MKFNTLLTTVADMILDGNVSVEIKGAPGGGKTAFTKALPATLQKLTGKPWARGEIFCPNVEYPDLAGMQFKKDVEMNVNGRVQTVAVADPTVPFWCLLDDGSTVWDHEHGIIVLEEMGQASAEVRKTLANLRLEKRINNWKLPAGWAVIALSNRSSDRSGVTKEYDHEINRRVELNLDSDPDGWAMWANAAGMNDVLISFAQTNVEVVFGANVPDKQGPWCTPRSLEILNNALRRRFGPDGSVPTDATAMEVMNGIIGEGAANQLVATAKLASEMPPFETVVADPDNAHCPDDRRPDAQMLVTYRLAAKADGKNFAALIRYMSRMPGDFTMTFIKGACSRNPHLVNTDAFHDWGMANRALADAIMPTLRS